MLPIGENQIPIIMNEETADDFPNYSLTIDMNSIEPLSNKPWKDLREESAKYVRYYMIVIQVFENIDNREEQSQYSFKIFDGANYITALRDLGIKQKAKKNNNQEFIGQMNDFAKSAVFTYFFFLDNKKYDIKADKDTVAFEQVETLYDEEIFKSIPMGLNWILIKEKNANALESYKAVQAYINTHEHQKVNV